MNEYQLCTLAIVNSFAIMLTVLVYAHIVISGKHRDLTHFCKCLKLAISNKMSLQSFLDDYIKYNNVTKQIKSLIYKRFGLKLNNETQQWSQ